jgi:hypothetical protein
MVKHEPFLPGRSGQRSDVLKVAQRLVLVAATLAGACATTGAQSDLVGQRAAFDLQCGRSQLQISSLGNNTFGVVGCGKRAAYVVSCTANTVDSCTAIMNTAESPPNAPASAR